MKKDPHLRDAQEILILKYIDGEHSMFEGLRVKSLLKVSKAAREFYDTFCDLKLDTESALKTALRDVPEEGVDLWSKIEMRIEQEERAEFYLGRRPVVEQAHGGGMVKPFAWGMGGGFVAVALALMMMQPAALLTDATQPAGLSEFQVASSSQARIPAQQFQMVSSADPYEYDRQAVEVDWMRSDGSVKLIQNPKEDAAIIWVRRRKPIQYYQKRSKNGIRIIDRTVPGTIAVRNK